MTVDRELRDAVALVFVEDLEAPELDPAVAHHLVEVLRVAASEPVAVSDGRGAYRMGTVAPIAGGVDDDGRGERRGRLRARDVELVVAGPPRLVPPPTEPVTVGFGIPKGDRAEWIIQKLTELGVDVIVPLLTDRTVVRLDRERRARGGPNGSDGSREASSQSRRVHLPDVRQPCKVSDLPVDLASGAALGEPGGEPITPATRTILVGPEGGWSDAELSLGFSRVHLSDQILRAETAAVVAGTLLCATRGGVVDFVRSRDA